MKLISIVLLSCAFSMTSMAQGAPKQGYVEEEKKQKVEEPQSDKQGFEEENNPKNSIEQTTIPAKTGRKEEESNTSENPE